MLKNKYSIAVIAGDGIGKEVMPEGLRVLEATCHKFGINLEFTEYPFSSIDYYQKHGQMLPDDWQESLTAHDAIFFGAVGWPEILPDHISLWGSLLKFRREFDQYVNLRPVRLMPGVPSPLARREPGDIDFWIVRENTEGEYSSIGGRMFEDTDREFVVQETIYCFRCGKPESHVINRGPRGAKLPRRCLTQCRVVCLTDRRINRQLPCKRPIRKDRQPNFSKYIRYIIVAAGIELPGVVERGEAEQPRRYFTHLHPRRKRRALRQNA